MLLPGADGPPPEIGLDLKADGTTVTGTITGPPVTIRDGHVEGDTLTLNLNNANGQSATLTGQMSDGGIVFRAVGLTPQPIHFVAVQDTRNSTGSITDAAYMQQLLKRFRVPGVSVAVIKDFKDPLAEAYGVADAETGRAGDDRARCSRRRRSASRWRRWRRCGCAGRPASRSTTTSTPSSSRGSVPAAAFTGEQPVTPRSLMSHTSGADDGFGFPGYAPDAPRPTLVQILDGAKPSNVGAVASARRRSPASSTRAAG